MPNSGFLTSKMVCRGKSDIWPSNVPSTSPTLALLLSEMAAEIGPILCRIITFGNSHLGIFILNISLNFYYSFFYTINHIYKLSLKLIFQISATFSPALAQNWKILLILFFFAHF